MLCLLPESLLISTFPVDFYFISPKRPKTKPAKCLINCISLWCNWNGWLSIKNQLPTYCLQSAYPFLNPPTAPLPSYRPAVFILGLPPLLQQFEITSLKSPKGNDVRDLLLRTVRSEVYYRTVSSEVYYRTVSSEVYYRTVRSEVYYRTVRSEVYYITVRSEVYYRTVRSEVYYRTVRSTVYYRTFRSTVYYRTVRSEVS